MKPSSRTPEGQPNHCPVCGKDLKIEPSRPANDAPCPHCGHLLWFQHTGESCSGATLPDYSVVMLEAGADRERMVRAVRRTNDWSDSEARALLGGRLPRVVNVDLSYDIAAIAQFELVCCDAISVIIPGEVIVGADTAYLKDLLAQLRQSDEFQEVTLRLKSVPWGEDGMRFLDQFLGLREVGAKAQQFPADLRMFHKKARIMAHWGDRIGAEASVTVGPQDE